MISLKQYGIELKRVDNSDIEMIRQWRNAPEIRKTMAFRKKISTSDQEKWFKKINNKLNYYFVILINDEPIGVINCKEVNEQEKYGEGGIFIGVEKYRGTPYPVFATLVLTDFIFNQLNYGDTSFIRTMDNNKIAQSYNRSLGYQLVPGQDSVRNQWYVLAKGVFNRKAKTLRKAAIIYSQTSGELVVEGIDASNQIKELNDYLKSASS
ncbi:MAG: RimJ/RimL family protein N-acetyltransferase [Parvicellaceae bacterium]|jgi:RimJ/RimL family protein N-acetyltransferase